MTFEAKPTVAASRRNAPLFDKFVTSQRLRDVAADQRADR